jgi:hypothetical protein
VGKSTLARQLAERLQLPLYHLDRLFWRPGWQPTPRTEWVQIQQEIIAQDRWLIDGNYGWTCLAGSPSGVSRSGSSSTGAAPAGREGDLAAVSP